MFGDGGELYGMNIGVGSSFNDVTFYTRKAFETRVFNKKFYLFPIPQSEINKAEKIVQNPWW